MGYQELLEDLFTILFVFAVIGILAIVVGLILGVSFALHKIGIM